MSELMRGDILIHDVGDGVVYNSLWTVTNIYYSHKDKPEGYDLQKLDSGIYSTIYVSYELMPKHYVLIEKQVVKLHDYINYRSLGVDFDRYSKDSDKIDKL